MTDSNIIYVRAPDKLPKDRSKWLEPGKVYKVEVADRNKAGEPETGHITLGFRDSAYILLPAIGLPCAYLGTKPHSRKWEIVPAPETVDA